MSNPQLADEVFGPASVLVRCTTDSEMREVLESLEGQLTATLQLDGGDIPLASMLMPVLERKAGRIIANAFPTNVEVSHAMVHGGAVPATSDSRTTSVGARAIDRFLCPVSYRNVPQALLPTALRDGNPLELRQIDGEWDRQ